MILLIRNLRYLAKRSIIPIKIYFNAIEYQNETCLAVPFVSSKEIRNKWGLKYILIGIIDRFATNTSPHAAPLFQDILH